MSQHEVRHVEDRTKVEDRTTNLTSRRAFLRTGLALGARALNAGLLVNVSASAVGAGVGVDILSHQVSEGG